ncbi:type III-B CRISPR module-associated protein Cmr5 [Corallococcus macrosporus]|uniref:CRISPR type III-B/RAMP module-associated protein Cmr5 n=1 Tax=Corallococcus macrosporus DSM 14697 TaxID=1189310 RepID=A0A286NVZ2_9BACT|nr:type III-B CRISPR module-associated protein Cmr5 [Corallococcus macrosporus]ATB51337.1 CRISPR-associated protein Cmr5 [Corallococcus macrosporus DSM 14697]
MTGQTREQRRALEVYARVREVRDRHPRLCAEYKPRVNGLGAAVLRDGLAAALSFLERERTPATDRLLEDLAVCLAQVLSKPGLRGEELPEAVRNLKLEAYMLATREALRLLVWFRRAVQSTFPAEASSHG